MAMNGSWLGQEIYNAIISASAPPEVQEQVLQLWQKIGAAIVAHITTNSEAPPGIAVSTPASPGATTGTG
jgi:hypothetical protein